MKKILLVLMLLFLPFSVVEAFPNEPAGYANLYWGESLSNVKRHYATNFIKYNGQAGATYMVSIPDAHGELGVKGHAWAICSFTDNRLWGITLYFPRNDVDIERGFQNQRKYLTSICGEAKYNKGYYTWFGNTTVMGLSRKKKGYAIDMVDARFMKLLFKYMKNAEKAKQ